MCGAGDLALLDLYPGDTRDLQAQWQGPERVAFNDVAEVFVGLFEAIALIRSGCSLG